MQDYQLTRCSNYTRIEFSAMASPCEILIRSLNQSLCDEIAQLAFAETQRIEAKFSRYRQGNLVDKMNHSHGNAVAIDQETFNWLEYANNLYQLSNGLFDITSGVLRTIWQFTSDAVPPSQADISKTLSNIGFDKIRYDTNYFYLPKGMQIDFGGIGKEYAVDHITHLLRPLCEKPKTSYLVNFGGDLSAVRLQPDDPPWVIGLEPVNSDKEAASTIKIAHGAVATSGNTKRFFDYKGKRYGHLLNPKTGYPIADAPKSITAFADQCVIAGTLTSLAMLKGADAEKFLTEQNVDHICIW